MTEEERAPAPREQLRDLIRRLAGIDAEDLARKDLGPFNFEGAVGDIQKSIALFTPLLTTPLDAVPDQIVNELLSVATEALQSLQAIQDFSPVNLENPTQERDNLVNQVQGQHLGHWQTVSRVLRPMPTDESLNEFVDRIRKASDQADTSTRELQRKLDEANQIVASMRDAAAATGARRHVQLFRAEADDHKKAAERWLRWLVGLLVAAGSVGIGVFFVFPPQIADPTSLTIYLQQAAPRILVLTLFLYGVRMTRQVYGSHKHNETLNRHRQNALDTFETFVQATEDPQTRSAVLLEATRSIFSVQSSGYLAREREYADSAQVLEILRDTQSVSPARE